MAKIKFVRAIETATVGPVQPGDVHDVIEADADRYVRNGWAERVTAPKKAPAKKAAG
jgi:hypothetical protein